MSTESIVRQLSSGVLSGTVIALLNRRGHYFLSYLTFTSIGLLDLAYHLNYLQAHLTHLTYEGPLRSRLNELQRQVQRELRWSWNDLRRYIDRHIYYGMGFTLSFLFSSALLK